MSKLSQQSYELELNHDNGEVKKVRVIHARLYLGKIRKPILVTHWPLAGEFSLELKENKLIKAPRWHALSINDAWKLWYKMVSATDKDKREEIPSYLRMEIAGNISGDILKC